MATQLPQTSTEFLQINGVGDRKLSQFGEMFMVIIRQNVKKSKMEQGEKTKPIYAGSTFDETRKLLLQKISIAEIVKRRGLSIGTIVSHIEKIVDVDAKIDVAHLKPPQERFETITSAFKKTGGNLLAPVHEILGENYSYDEIRFARIFLKQF